MFPNLPRPSANDTFIYRGMEVTSEQLGNILYGYTGTAMGCSPTILYIGGGMAKQIHDFGNASFDALSSALINCMKDT